MKINRLSEIQQCQTSEARKSKSSKIEERGDEQVRSSCKCEFWNFFCLFRSQGSRFGCGPVLSVLSLLSIGPTPDECEAAHGPQISDAAHPGRQGEVSTHCRLTGRESVPLPGSRPGVVSLEQKYISTQDNWHRHTGRAQGQFPFGSRPALVPRLVNG